MREPVVAMLKRDESSSVRASELPLQPARRAVCRALAAECEEDGEPGAAPHRQILVIKLRPLLRYARLVVGEVVHDLRIVEPGVGATHHLLRRPAIVAAKMKVPWGHGRPKSITW